MSAKTQKDFGLHIAIIGAGFTGLSACYYLSKLGHNVTVFEKENLPGGLAIGFKDKKWTWPLEAHYHHLFTSDNAIINLSQEIGHKIVFTLPITSTLYNNQIHKLDSVLSLLKFPFFTPLDKLRTGLTLLYLKITSDWKSLEQKYAKTFLIKTMGTNVWKILWEPLFSAKFGKYANKITASWFWARIKKRSASLGYPKGGFQKLAISIQKSSEKLGAKFYFNTAVININKKASSVLVKTNTSKKFEFDTLIFTLPAFQFLQITDNLPASYVKKIKNLNGLGAINLVLALKKKFLKNDTYWLNINDPNYPFLAVVEHTNFINSKKYGGDKLVYIGNYLEKNHPYFTYTPKKLLREYTKDLKRINPAFNNTWVRKIWKFSTPFAQPILPLNYSQKILPHITPINRVYLANMQQVYPWDRGTNYAVEMGGKIAKIIHEKNNK